jgi:hypothetical protein
MTDNAKSILIKLSGNLYRNLQVIEAIDKISSYSEVTLICGIGAPYGEKLDANKIPFHWENGIRKINDPRREQEAFRIGLALQREIQEELKHRIPGIRNFIDCLYTDESGLLVNENGDDLVRKHGDEYDEIIVYTKLKETRNKSELAKRANTRIVYIRE